MSESQRIIRWPLIIGEFNHNIQHIAGVDNIVADTLSILLSMPSNKYNPCTRKVQCCAKYSFVFGRVENTENSPPQNIS